MKNKHLLFALPLLFGVLLFSCQDEATEAAENNVDKVVYNATIEKAKAIFESKSPDFPIIQSLLWMAWKRVLSLNPFGMIHL